MMSTCVCGIGGADASRSVADVSVSSTEERPSTFSKLPSTMVLASFRTEETSRQYRDPNSESHLHPVRDSGEKYLLCGRTPGRAPLVSELLVARPSLFFLSRTVLRADGLDWVVKVSSIPPVSHLN